MSMKEEIYKDITENCNIILDLLKNFNAENETPEGRMIYQCNWLKEQIISNSLPLPVEDFVQTLKYISNEGLLNHLASTKENEWQEIGTTMYRLNVLVDNKLIIKKSYYRSIIRVINGLIALLCNASRNLDQYELSLTNELENIKNLLSKDKVSLPLESYFPDYPNFREVYSLTGSSIDDLPNGKYLCKTVANSIFEGVRPNTWLTPEDAEQDIKKLE